MAPEILKTGLWYKLISPSLRYLASLGKSTPQTVARSRTVSPSTRSYSHRSEAGQFPLDTIFNQQKPDHPSNMFSHTALGHTRSFSTGAADHARKFPERGRAFDKHRKTAISVNPEKRFDIGSKRHRASPSASSKRFPVRHRSKGRCKPDMTVKTSSTKLRSFSEIGFDQWFRQFPEPSPYKSRPSVVQEQRFDGMNNVSKSATVLQNQIANEEQQDKRPSNSNRLFSGLKQIRTTVLQSWLTQEPHRGPIAEMELLRYYYAFINRSQ